MVILNFPHELLLMVAEYLSIGDLSKFRLTSREIWLVLTPRYEKLCLEDIGKLTALQWAAVRGYVELIELAISKGAEINKPLGSNLEMTAPRMSDKPGAVCLLVNRTACLDDAKDALARTPLYLAACSGKVRAINVLLQAGASMQCLGEIDTPAHISASKGDVKSMQEFINAGFDINTRGCGASTILHEAMQGGIKIVMYLLEHAGGERLVNAKDICHRTPLHLVARSFPVRYKRRAMTKLLLKHGADIHVRDRIGNTPAHLAAFPGDVDTMRVLIAAGIDFHAPGAYGETILHRAMQNRKGVLQYLLRQEGVKKIIHVKDNFAWTPLDHAKRLGVWEAMNRLVELSINN